MFRTTTVLAAALLLGACNTMSIMEMPKVAATDQQIEIQNRREQPPIAFEKAVSSIRRGTVIAHYPGSAIDGVSTTMCNSPKKIYEPVEWGSGHQLLGSWSDEAGTIFYETFKDAGYNIVGNPNKMFDANADRLGAKYLIAARILEIRGNLCEAHTFWEAIPMGRYAGEMYQKVEWSVYAPRRKEVVATIETEGYSLLKTTSQQGINRLFLDSFGVATENLARNQEFADLIAGNKQEIADGEVKYTALTIPRQPMRSLPFRQQSKSVLDSVVTVSLGQAHGSGFIISDDGLILTNQHVVANAKEVLIRFSNGLEVPGEVIRKDSHRDVALVRVPLRGLKPLPLRTSPAVKVLDPVVAVGSPVDEGLQSTVTKGVVSNPLRKLDDGLTFIQSDTSINGGNSGGPLLDENGNVIAITVLSYAPSGGDSGINFFIPISDALRKLNITLAAPAT